MNLSLSLKNSQRLVFSTMLVLLTMGAQSALALTPLSDQELSKVNGRGAITLYQDVAKTLDPQHSSELAEKIAFVQKGLLSQILDYDETVDGKLDRSVTTVETVGDEVHITTQVDEYVSRITLSNIRVKGTPETGPSFGSITMNDISIQGTITSIYHH